MVHVIFCTKSFPNNSRSVPVIFRLENIVPLGVRLMKAALNTEILKYRDYSVHIDSINFALTMNGQWTAFPNCSRYKFVDIHINVHLLVRTISSSRESIIRGASPSDQHILQMINTLDNRFHVAMINRFSSTRPFAFMNRGAKTYKGDRAIPPSSLSIFAQAAVA